MSALRSTISRLAEEFAAQILVALRGASLQDLSGLSTSGPARHAVAPAAERAAAKPGGRLAKAGAGSRRTAVDFERISAAVVELLKKNPDGLRAEEIQKELGLSRKDLPRPMSHALAANLIRKKGQKRATRYFAR